jgi:hypothetical protein
LKEVKNQFEYYKIVHSRIDPKIVYNGENYIWFSDNIDATIAKDNFNNYNPDNL